MAAQVKEAAAGRKRPSPAAAAASRALLAVPTEREMSVHPASGGRRAAFLQIGAREAAPEAVAHRGAAAVVGAAAGKQERKTGTLTKKGALGTEEQEGDGYVSGES